MILTGCNKGTLRELKESTEKQAIVHLYYSTFSVTAFEIKSLLVISGFQQDKRE